MTALGQALIIAAILAVAVVYGTDAFCAIALRPALALVDDRTLASIMGRVHEFADRRMRLPGIAGLLAAIAGALVIGLAGHPGATIPGAVAIVAQVIWILVYNRISAPINRQLTDAAQRQAASAAMGQRDHDQSWSADAGDPGTVHRHCRRLKSSAADLFEHRPDSCARKSMSISDDMPGCHEPGT